MLTDYPNKLYFVASDATAYLVPLVTLPKGSNRKIDTSVREYEWRYEHKDAPGTHANKTGRRFSISLKDINDKIACKSLIVE